eukprot:c12079_g1_i1.p1 GENE.c12079_g1_i1~~c12079_g1_i1.p1  ORF type:complete len:356 (-),score=120.45 c12079_g1_i1:85-1152(-)
MFVHQTSYLDDDLMYLASHIASLVLVVFDGDDVEAESNTLTFLQELQHHDSANANKNHIATPSHTLTPPRVVSCVIKQGSREDIKSQPSNFNTINSSRESIERPSTTTATSSSATTSPSPSPLVAASLTSPPSTHVVLTQPDDGGGDGDEVWRQVQGVLSSRVCSYVVGQAVCVHIDALPPRTHTQATTNTLHQDKGVGEVVREVDKATHTTAHTAIHLLQAHSVAMLHLITQIESVHLQNEAKNKKLLMTVGAALLLAFLFPFAVAFALRFLSVGMGDQMPSVVSLIVTALTCLTATVVLVVKGISAVHPVLTRRQQRQLAECRRCVNDWTQMRLALSQKLLRACAGVDSRPLP